MAKRVIAVHAKGKKAKPARRGKPEAPPQVAQPDPTDPEPEAPPVVAEYAQCACGGRLVTDEEKDAGKCEECLKAERDSDARIAEEQAELLKELAPFGAELITRINAFAVTHGADYKRICDSGADPDDMEAWKAYDGEADDFSKSLPEDFPLDADAILSDIENDEWKPLPVPQPETAPEEGSVAESATGPASPSPDGPSQAAAAPATSGFSPSNESEKPEVPSQQRLPLPIPPFDFRVAFEDLATKARLIQAQWKTYNELHKKAADLKKQIEAAESTYWGAAEKYDEAKREAEAEAIRQEKVIAAYEEKAAEDAAKRAQPELPMEAAEETPNAVSTNLRGDEQADDSAPATTATRPPDTSENASDSAPTDETPAEAPAVALPDTSVSECACGKALATNDEAAAGQCSECAPPPPVEAPAPASAWNI